MLPLSVPHNAIGLPFSMLHVIKNHSKSVIIQGTSAATPKILYAYLRRESRRRINMKIGYTSFSQRQYAESREKAEQDSTVMEVSEPSKKGAG